MTRTKALIKSATIYRLDKIYNLNIKEEVLKNAPNHNSDYIKVPKVIS